ncbi:MAG: DUF1552 domain-containing protein [Deltaproteobacteria bacterium]|nr:DUF1552 domain-containing protein [Deltaproteobacteria bacterium]
MGKPFRLPRRAFLAGLGGTAISLPLLEVMHGSAAHAAVDPRKRMVICFAGSSLPRLDLVIPSNQGANYNLPRALAPLASVQDQVSVVSGLKIPWDTGSGAPTAGRPINFHASTLGPLLSGARSQHTGSSAGNPRPFAPTADQVVAQAMDDGLRFRSLEYRIQAESYRGGTSKGRVSYEDANGSIREREPIAQPSLAYEQLFTGFVPDDPAEAAQRRFLLAQDQSILDLVGTRADRLRARLGRSDLVRIERHFDEIRDLERRLSEISEPTGACNVFPHPGPDPVAVTYIESDKDAGRVIGYAQEEQRARVMNDLIHMAITCDLTRAVSLQHTFAQSFMSALELIGVGSDFHELGHGAGEMEDFADAVGWHMRHWTYLIEKLRSTEEMGGTLLDQTAMVFLFEGGRGYDPEGDRNDSTHSTENMMVLVAGNGSALKLGEHIVASDRHPAEVTLTAMRSIGVDDNLGELNQPIDSLLA